MRAQQCRSENINVIISAVENCEKQTSAIQKIRQLQENELQAILDTGTYVQCCDCSKWRSVPGSP